ncbi:MAG TPA: Do family serine endopeptidase [Ignavibacteria bacterium]|nr:Do family serine endopeptidase [Ignavibacteria bacterium]
MKRKSIYLGSALILATILFTAVLLANFNGVKTLSANPQVQFNTKAPVENVSGSVKDFNNAFVEISQKVTPTVVFIDVTGEAKPNSEENKGFEFFFGPDFKMDEQPVHGSGSGVIISADGYILTNNHVIKDASSKGIKVVLNDKREFQAKLIGSDPNTDVAVIKIDADNLPVSAIGNSDDVKVGEWVLAIGNPLGLNNTVTAGIVSAIGRNINISGDSYAINNFIQTDAVINPGNSGGALVDINGFVIGINAAIKTTTGYYQGYGFAIPINMAKASAEEIIKYGKVERGYIGVSIKDVDSKDAKGFGLDKARGVMVQNVIKGGAGDDAGLKAGDIILKIDGKEVNAANELQTIIGSHRPGEEVNLTIFRDGSTTDKKVKLKPRSGDVSSNDLQNAPENRSQNNNADKKFDKIGLTVTSLDSKTKSSLDISNGVLIKDVVPYSESFNRGLRAGLVILEVNKQTVSSVSDVSSIIDSKSEGDVIVFKVILPNKEIRLVAIEL